MRNLVRFLITLSILLASTLGSYGEEEKLKTSFILSVSGFKDKEGDDIKFTDTILRLYKKEDQISFDVGLGSIVQPSVSGWSDKENISTVGDKFGIVWGYLTLKPLEKLKVDVGAFGSLVGYTTGATFYNPNISFSFLGCSQPFFYRAVRVTYQVEDDLSFYGTYARGKELNGNDNDHAHSFGVIGKEMGIDYVVSYFDYSAFKNIFDVVLSTSSDDFLFNYWEKVTLALNIDYQWLDGSSKDSFGFAFWVVPEKGRYSLPLRFEYENDFGGSNIFTNDGGYLYSITVTPTYKLSDTTKLRVEFVHSGGSISNDIVVFQVLYLLR
ncbi:MAG: outer membrane beta-barrel protein [Desulfurobacteriaceae bacterium]